MSECFRVSRASGRAGERECEESLGVSQTHDTRLTQAQTHTETHTHTHTTGNMDLKGEEGSESLKLSESLKRVVVSATGGWFWMDGCVRVSRASV